MILSISTSHKPTSDLGYIFHKHPDKFQSFNFSAGKYHIFYPELNNDKATICLLLDIDPIEIVKILRNNTPDGFPLGDYVNDRPYVASSFMSVAIAKGFSSAIKGKCKEKPELVNTKLPFEVFITSLPSPKGGEILIRKLFEPLGYQLEIERQTLDLKFPEWGMSKYYNVKLKNTLTTKELLSHLYLLIPVLDFDKHYFISDDEIEKLIDKGTTWLNIHPEKEQIIRRYLINLNSLTSKALERISDNEILNNETEKISIKDVTEQKKETLHIKRINTVVDKLIESGAKTILDLGCGEGKLIKQLLKHKQFNKITGMDVSYNELLKAKERLNYNDLPPKQKERINLIHGSLTYRDKRLEGYDAAALIEVIEHLELSRLKSMERVLFEFAKPKLIIITTPNKEYNSIWEKLDSIDMRHKDHRFEWTRSEFLNWSINISKTYNYNSEIFPIGEEIENIGAPTQMAIFKYGN
ncbi:MAG TPA: 3' terminal RNA ribose 2'-O-methyltransferase Hen1 [Bacteroidetes bacterium]|mgnify:CR=1 FL=1|nr:3' terminal RNA ribose 2'-O-methyltransferase Hen1 [Bacteroidota bacterium]HCN38232.1 3' terminal RNA ribose 2'-O-methyltransferase Hen1 [Bacteroidota bacterium]